MSKGTLGLYRGAAEACAKDTYQHKHILKVFQNDFWRKNVILDFIAAYQVAYGRGPAQHVIERTGLLGRNETPRILQLLVEEGWIHQTDTDIPRWVTDVFM